MESLTQNVQTHGVLMDSNGMRSSRIHTLFDWREFYDESPCISSAKYIAARETAKNRFVGHRIAAECSVNPVD